MKAIKQIILIILFLTLLFTSFKTYSQDSYKDIGYWHNYVLKDVYKSMDSKTKSMYLKNPSLLQDKMIEILVDADPKIFNKEKLKQAQIELNIIFKDVEWSQTGLINFIKPLKTQVSSELYNQLVAIINSKNRDSLTTKIKKLRNSIFSKKDQVIADVFLEVHDASSNFWSNQGKKNWMARLAWDAAGAIVGS